MSKIDPKVLSYEGCDLEAMSNAPRYYRWVISVIRPYFGDHVVEVGAGAGSFSRQLLATNPERATFIEPTKNMYALLKKTIAEVRPKNTKTAVYQAYLDGAQKKLEGTKPDTFIYINVFEHIEDDLKELKTIKKLLPKGGHAIIFVPALQGLYSEFDESIGHYRRYSKKSVTELAEKAGLEVVKTRYMDMPGIVPWYASFKVMKRKRLMPKMIGYYDSYFVPFIRTAETVVPAPIGKNVLLVARKK